MRRYYCIYLFRLLQYIGASCGEGFLRESSSLRRLHSDRKTNVLTRVLSGFMMMMMRQSKKLNSKIGRPRTDRSHEKTRNFSTSVFEKLQVTELAEELFIDEWLRFRD